MKKTLAILLVVTMMLAGASIGVAEETINITVFHYMAQATSRPVWRRSKALTANCIPTLPSPTYTIIRAQTTSLQLSTALSSGDQPTSSWATPACIPILSAKASLWT